MKNLLNELAMVCETIKCKNARSFRMGDLSSPAEIKAALEKIISKHRARIAPRRICQAQGGGCLVCDLANCGDRLYARR